jgi:hypothetical protein
MSLETAQKVIVPQKKNYVPHFLKQRDINSYFIICTKAPLKMGGTKTTCLVNNLVSRKRKKYRIFYAI